jgi:hypothetical protein
MEAIRELAARYAQAMDARDLDTLVGLFVEDVGVRDGRIGRAALAEWYDSALRVYTVGFHLIGNHIIELVDDDHAHATLYCRAEQQVGERWIVMPFMYDDDYARRGGQWLFVQRRVRAFYAVDVLDQPNAVPGRFDYPGNPVMTSAELPEAWQSWQQFWLDGDR